MSPTSHNNATGHNNIFSSASPFLQPQRRLISNRNTIAPDTASLFVSCCAGFCNWIISFSFTAAFLFNRCQRLQPSQLLTFAVISLRYILELLKHIISLQLIICSYSSSLHTIHYSTMPTREKSRPRPRGSDEEFVVFLQGVS